MTRRTHGPVLVVGTGLLGASIGLALRGRGVDVLLADPSPTAVALARDVGAGRIADADAGGAPSAPTAVHPTLVVVAAPPDVTAEVVAAQLARHPEAVVTDVASVKARVLAGLRDRGADLGRYVGGHPLAGRERSGAVAARPDLFVGRPWVVTPTPESSRRATTAVQDLARDCAAVPVVMDADRHDNAVAVVSHAPQVAASLVAARLRDTADDAVGLAGQGVRDVTRIAASDPMLWSQILAGNAGPVAAVLRQLRDGLERTVLALEDLAADDDAPGARAVLAQVIAEGNAGRARIPGKHGAAPTTYATLTVLVPDAPGELARLLTDVGRAGVNLEDLHLEHSAGRPVGLAEVSVLPAQAEHLTTALTANGWTFVA